MKSGIVDPLNQVDNKMDNGPQTLDEAAALLLLHPDDNVLVCRRDLRAGEVLVINGEKLVVPTDVALGHKIARRFIGRAKPVIKYGMSIGSSTAEIAPGEWVHLHNMKSDYLPSHTRQSRSTE